MIAKVRRSATAAASLSASAMSQISCFALRPLLAGLAQNASSHAIHARSGIRKKGQGQTVKVGIDMGLEPGGKPAMLDLEELLATRLLVQGNSGSGKSHPLRPLIAQSAERVPKALNDPKGEFGPAADPPGQTA